jgi:4-hydroxybenzoyl-CoA reductase subunit beta
MLRLPRFGVQTPLTLEDAVAALAEPGARLVAGGTDILPNLKHRLDKPPTLVSLSRVKSLREIAERDGMLILGAGVTLTEIAEHPRVREVFPSVAHAAGVIASPLIRNMGTLGGNVNLDTRCRYVNQTHFWRSAIGGCMKSEGDVCHVVPKGRICVAAMSSDLVPVLGSLDAVLVNQGPDGPRELPLLDYYGADGTQHIKRLPGEVTREIRIPLPTGATRAKYAKWTVRKSIDFPLVSVAVRFDLASDSVDAEVTGVSVVVGVLGSKPRGVTRLDVVMGRRVSDPEVATLVADRTHAQCKPLDNVPYEAGYRRQMIRVFTQRAVESLVAEG